VRGKHDLFTDSSLGNTWNDYMGEGKFKSKEPPGVDGVCTAVVYFSRASLGVDRFSTAQNSSKIFYL